MKFRNYLVSGLAFLFASAAVAETVGHDPGAGETNDRMYNDTSLTQRGSYGVSYAWSYTGPSSIKLIIVWFDAATGNVVTRVGGNNGETQAPFKSSSGF